MVHESRPHVDEQVFLLLGQTYAHAKKMAEKRFTPLGITIAEYSLLRIIQNTPRITAGEARRRLFSSAPSVAQLVKSVEKKGLIARKRDSQDIRRQKILLTAKGKTVIAKARTSIESSLRASRIPAGVLSSLRDSLTLLSSSLSSYGD